jgi:hypothetical protein
MRGKMLGLALDLAAVGAFGLYLATAVPTAVRRGRGLLALPSQCAGESEAAVRARFWGPSYVAGIDEIRRSLPVDEPYLLVEAGRPQDGGVYWVRFDLAPRRAVYLGHLTELTDANRLRRRLTSRPRRVVISRGPGQAPLLMERYRFVAEIERGAAAGAGAAGAGAARGTGAPTAPGTGVPTPPAAGVPTGPGTGAPVPSHGR